MPVIFGKQLAARDIAVELAALQVQCLALAGDVAVLTTFGHRPQLRDTCIELGQLRLQGLHAGFGIALRLAGLLTQRLQCFRGIRIIHRAFDCIQCTRCLLDACLRGGGSSIGTGRIL